MNDAVANARRGKRKDDFWRSDLKSPSEDEARRRFRLDFKQSCRLLEAKSLEGWQKQECARNGGSSAQKWEFQTQAPRQETYNSNMAQVCGWPKKRLPRVCTSEIEPTLLPPSSPVSTSSTACSSVDLELAKHDRLLCDSWEASSASSTSSVANTMTDLVPLGHGSLRRGHDSASSVNHLTTQYFDMSADLSVKQNHLTTEYFDISASDFDEVEKEFFPEDFPVMASS